MEKGKMCFCAHCRAEMNKDGWIKKEEWWTKSSPRNDKCMDRRCARLTTSQHTDTHAKALITGQEDKHTCIMKQFLQARGSRGRRICLDCWHLRSTCCVAIRGAQTNVWRRWPDMLMIMSFTKAWEEGRSEWTGFWIPWGWVLFCSKFLSQHYLVK